MSQIDLSTMLSMLVNTSCVIREFNSVSFRSPVIVLYFISPHKTHMEQGTEGRQEEVECLQGLLMRAESRGRTGRVSRGCERRGRGEGVEVVPEGQCLEGADPGRGAPSQAVCSLVSQASTSSQDLFKPRTRR